MAANDERIEFHVPTDRQELAQQFVAADALAVPSQGFETGPLVVLEAKAAGLPVLGSRLGGIAELVRPGVDGWLVDHDDVRAWATAIERIAAGGAVVRAPGEAVRTTDDIAREMIELYAIRDAGAVA